MKISGDCAKFFELMSDLADGTLQGKERTELEEHLKTCPACLHYCDSLKALKECIKNGCADCADVSKLVDDCVRKFLSNK